MDLHVHVDPFEYGGSTYAVDPELVPVRLDVSRTTGNGWALRLRFDGDARGPVHALPGARERRPTRSTPTRSTSRARATRSCSRPTSGEELDLEAWARDALALALPAQLTCRPDCAGLCPKCGANLNEDPDARARAGARRALVEALRAEVRLGGARYPSSPPWPSLSKSSRTRARRSAGRSTRSPRPRSTAARSATSRVVRTACARNCGFYGGREVVHVHDHDHDHEH